MKQIYLSYSGSCNDAQDWCAELTKVFGVLFVVPWVPLELFWGHNPALYELQVRLRTEAVTQCNAAWFVAPASFTRFQAAEEAAARAAGLPLRFLTLDQLCAVADAFTEVEAGDPLLLQALHQELDLL